MSGQIPEFRYTSKVAPFAALVTAANVMMLFAQIPLRDGPSVHPHVVTGLFWSLLLAGGVTIWCFFREANTNRRLLTEYLNTWHPETQFTTEEVNRLEQMEAVVRSDVEYRLHPTGRGFDGPRDSKTWKLQQSPISTTV